MKWKKWGKGKGSRKNQKSRVHEVMKVTNGVSRLRVCERCENWWRTMMGDPQKVAQMAEMLVIASTPRKPGISLWENCESSER